MNQYDYNSPSAKEEAPEERTLTNLVGITDQVDAAVKDVWAAWWGFKDGPQPANPPSNGIDRAVQSDRIGRSQDTLNDSIRQLTELAREIRRRA